MLYPHLVDMASIVGVEAEYRNFVRTTRLESEFLVPQDGSRNPLTLPLDMKTSGRTTNSTIYQVGVRCTEVRY